MRLLLLPGTLCDAAVWAPIIAGVADMAECVVGDTDRHETIEAAAEALLAEHPGAGAVAGFSFGGFVALRMAAVAPQRVRGLALIGTVALPLPAEQHPERQRRLAVAEAQGVAAYVEALLPVYLHPDNLADPSLRAAIVGMAERRGIAALGRQTRANMTRPDARVSLSAIRVPTMVLCGAADPICRPANHRTMAAGIPGAVLTEVAGAGHFVTLERPDAVVAALRDWLLRLDTLN